ncbi:MAG: Gfo/Idh/MocA family oxidoreductase [Opitutae bacterium]|jgi:predicted dehydrogenase|nr:Gfo/Idh/MocA family oxidoreductase [Opitutae bacterium]
MKKIKLAVVGAGAFARVFIPLFKAHPQVRAVCLAEVLPDRRRAEAAAAGITETFATFEDVLASDCDAVAIFTQRWLHAPMAIAALKAGKHVYSAVPAAMTLAELTELVEVVKRTGLTYALGETSYYYPSTVFCREMWRQGKFGRFVYGEGEYMHDMSHGFYEAYQHSGGADWKRTAGVPPMLYPTHTVSMIVGVTGARLTQVSCLGQVDQSGDGVFGPGLNLWDNAFSNETALFRTSDGGAARINELRRVGHWGGRSVRLSLFGTEGCFEEQPEGEVWVNRAREVTKLTELLRCGPITTQDRAAAQIREDGTQHDFHSGMAPVHPVWRLPKEYEGLGSGHHGSHQFLVDDFCRAVGTGALPPNHVWAAARYNLPGIIAHESALRGGELMPVPDLGGPPDGARLLEDELAKLAPTTPTWSLPKPDYTGEKWW